MTGPERAFRLQRVLALLLVAGGANAQTPPGTTLQPAAPPSQTATAPQSVPAVSPEISYVGGKLAIHMHDSTLADVLAKVAALTNVKIDLPDDQGAQRMPLIELGPGPARQVLARLLSDADMDYLIQASAADPEKIQSVLLLPREKKGNGTNGVDAVVHSPYVRAAAIPQPAPAPDVPPPAQPTSAAADVAAVEAQPEPARQFSLSQPDQSTALRPGAMTPPQTLNPQSINQQLQQMYQQRMQMTQQDRRAGSPPTANLGSK